MTWSLWIFFGALFAGTGVGMGAFGAHALREIMLNEHLQVFETAVRYQMYHAFALLFVGLLALRTDHILVPVAGVLFTIGIVAFSGSLYAIVLAGQRQLGIVTPIGGAFLILAWLCLLIMSVSLWWRT